jgi:hypothetical protein
MIFPIPMMSALLLRKLIRLNICINDVEGHLPPLGLLWQLRASSESFRRQSRGTITSRDEEFKIPRTQLRINRNVSQLANAAGSPSETLDSTTRD